MELNKNYFTVSMWVKRDNLNSDIGLFSYGEYSHHQGFMLQMRNSGNGYDFHIRASSSERPGFNQYNSGNVGWSNAMVVDQWAHVAVVKDDAQIRYYINGQPAGTPSPAPPVSPKTLLRISFTGIWPNPGD